MQKIIISYLIICLSVSCFAQEYLGQYYRTSSYAGSEKGIDIVETSDTGLLILADAENKMSLIKLDNDLNTQWEKFYGNYTPKSLCKTSDNGFTIGADIFNDSILMLHVDSAGNFLWAKKYHYEGLSIYDICQTQDGGYAISAESHLLKTDAKGNLEWAKRIEEYLNRFLSVTPSGDGNLMALGGYSDSAAGRVMYILYKLDLKSSVIWQAQYLDKSGYITYPRGKIYKAPDNSFIITGDTYYSGAFRIGVFNLNATGDVQWSKTVGGSSPENFGGITFDDLNNVYIAGNTKSFASEGKDAYFVKFDNNGSLIWSRTYTGSDDETLNEVVPFNNGFALIGNSESIDPGKLRTYAVITNEDGNSGGCNQKAHLSNHDDYAFVSKEAISGDELKTTDTISFITDSKTITPVLSPITLSKRTCESTPFYKIFGTLTTDEPTDGIQTFDGGYIVVGNYQDATPTDYTFAIKLDASGTIEWSKKINYTGSEPKVVETEDNGFIISGYSLTVKLMNDGSADWAYDYGGYDITKTSDGNYMIVMPASNAIELLKLDIDGDIKWYKKVNLTKSPGNLMITELNNGSFAINGYYADGDEDGILIKINDNGEGIWCKTIEGNPSGQERNFGLAGDNQGNIIYSISTNNYSVLKFDTLGNLMQAKGLGFVVRNMCNARNNHFTIIGNKMVNFDNDLNIKWSVSIPRQSYQIANTLNGGYLIPSKTFAWDAYIGGEDIYVLKADKNGNFDECYNKNSTISASDETTNFTINNMSVSNTTVVSSFSSVAAWSLDYSLNELDYYLQSTSEVENVKCYQGSTGAIDVTSTGEPSFSYTWSDGLPSQEDVSSIAAGNYSYTVEDGNGCSKTYFVTVTEPTQVVGNITDTTNVSCYLGTDGSLTANGSGGTPPYTYRWSNGKTAALNDNLYAGTYFLNVFDNNNCPSATLSARVSEPEPVSISIDEVDATCGNNNGKAWATVTGGTPSYTYSWNNGGMTDTINNLSPGTYYLTVIDNNLCTAYDSIQTDINALSVPICIVTVDEESGKNQIVWSKTTNQAVSHYNVYKQSYTGDFDFLAQIPFDSVSYCLDGTSNPETRAERYKISVVDSCGNESELSDHHKTLHLNVSKSSQGDGFALTWSHYEGFDFNTYQILRGTSESDLKVIDSIAYYINSFTYTDSDVSDDSTYYYRIAAIKPGGFCLATKASGGPFSRSISNLEDNRLKTENIAGNIAGFLHFNVSPNPTSGKIQIEYQLKREHHININIFSMLGNKIENIIDKKQRAGYFKLEHNLSDQGVYFIRCEVDDQIVTKNIICIK